MKRVRSACILQTLVFSQKPEMGYPPETAVKINRDEIRRYELTMERARIRYQIVSADEQPDGSIVLRVRKQYSDKADVSEYFE